MKAQYVVKAMWDEEAEVWTVVETNVPGLVTEAPTLEQLESNLEELIPELIEINDGNNLPEQIPFQLCTQKYAYA